MAVSERASELSAAAASPARATSPRVAVDVHMIGSRESGNETYMAQLAPALVGLGGYDYLFYASDAEALPAALRSSESVRLLPSVPSLLRKIWLYPRLVRADRARLLHVTGAAPTRARCPVISTVHDVTQRTCPSLYSPKHRLLSEVLIRRSIRSAAHILTISECSRRDIVRFYGIPEDRVTVTPLAAGPHFARQEPVAVERVRAQYGLARRYVLAVGTLQPRKNLSRLIAAFRAIAAELPDVELVLVGRSLWRGSEATRAVEEAGLEGRVRFTGYVPEADLPLLYAGAAVFCYPSLYEGFGMPPLEAMACGTPVVTSNTSSLPEVVGDAAITVPPSSVRAIAAGLRALLTSDSLSRDYRERGLARVPQFSWDRTARLTLAAYDAVLHVRR